MNDDNRCVSRGLRQLMTIDEYKGTCDHCQQPIQYSKFLVLALYITSEDVLVVCPLEILACPHCKSVLGKLEIYGTHIGNKTITGSRKAKLN